MKKYKVAHVINGIGLGGVTNTLLHLLSVLPHGHFEHLVCGLNQYGDHTKEREHQIARFRDLGIEPILFNEKEKRFDVVGDLCQWLIQHDVDILHTHSYKPNFYGRMAGILCRKPGLKIVAHYHNAYDDKWRRDNSLIYDQLLIPFTDHFIGCSSWVSQYVAQRVGLPTEKISTIPNGVDLIQFAARHGQSSLKEELGISEKSFTIGMVGRISKQKGQEDFLRAAKIIHQKFPDTVFLIIGAGKSEDTELLKRLSVQLNIEHFVHFIGHCLEMPKMFQALDLVLVPSLWEGFGLVLVEAMAAGKPIVATEVGAIPEVIIPGETALLVPPSSPPALAKEAIFLLGNPIKVQEMRIKGIERAKDFSWERSGTLLDNLYANLLKDNQN